MTCYRATPVILYELFFFCIFGKALMNGLCVHVHASPSRRPQFGHRELLGEQAKQVHVYKLVFHHCTSNPG